MPSDPKQRSSLPETKCPNPRVFFDLDVGSRLTGSRRAGRVIMKLYADSTPKTAENFRSLCTGERGVGRSGKPRHYKYSTIHRVIPGLMLQGGDFDGTGGESIYDGIFRPENFDEKHIGPGILSMFKSDEDTIGSQFLICTAAAPQFDGKHVVFGEVVQGMEVIRNLEKLGRENGNPTLPIITGDCGHL